MPPPTLYVSRASASVSGSMLRSTDSISISPSGSIYGLLGPNGSGKTTTIRMIMGILHPDEGQVRLFDSDLDLARRRLTGYLPEERGLYKKMKVICWCAG